MGFNTKILLRFDDICPTMNWEQWNRAKNLLDEKGKVALLGVVPDCQDTDLFIDEPRPDFWDYIKALHGQGYTIAMHGYKHVFECGHSEFAGLPYEKQLEKIQKGKAVLEEHGIETDVFFAPAHNYDDNTLRALSACGFKYMSDGLSRKPYSRFGVTLLPCRSGGIPRISKNSGFITAVVHAHEWVRNDKKQDWFSFNDVVNNHTDEIVSFSEFIKWGKGLAYTQQCDAHIYSFYIHHVKPVLVSIKKMVMK